MTPERFQQLIDRCTVQDVYGSHHPRILIRGMTREELTEIVTLAGQKLGGMPENAAINPEWLKLGPDSISP